MGTGKRQTGKFSTIFGVFVECGRLYGKRLLAGRSFLFVTKKEAKNRHRFEAVDADQGCGPGPGVCGHLTTAYSGPGGPEQGMDLKILAGKSVAAHGLP